MGPHARPRRFLGWQLRRTRCRRSHRHARFGYGRLHPPARCPLRRRRPEADLWPRFTLWPDRVRILARPDWPVRPHGRRCRHRARRHCRSRRTRFHVLSGGDPRLPRRSDHPPRPVETRYPEGVFRHRSRPRDRRSRRKSDRVLPIAGLRNSRGVPPAHSILPRHLLRHRDRRSVLEPRPLRRHSLRSPLDCRERRCRHLRPLARRGIRTGGEAPDYPRHLRAQLRLLRRLLSSRAKSSHAHPAGFS